jgi:hypothetical protein
LIRLDCHLFCREFMFDSSWQPFVNKWLSRRIKHELSTKEMAVKTSKTWTLNNTTGCQEESNMNSLQNKWLFHVLLVLTAISFLESSCLIRLDNHLFCREFIQMAVKRNQTWTLYNTIGSQDESNMNCLQNKWQSRGIKHELSTQQMAVKLPFLL